MLRSMLRSVMVCRAQASLGNPVGPSGVSRSAVVLNVHVDPAQFAVTCISIWFAGSTGTEVTPEWDAAAADAGNASAAAVSTAAAHNAVSLLIVIVKKGIRSLLVVGDFD